MAKGILKSATVAVQKGGVPFIPSGFEYWELATSGTAGWTGTGVNYTDANAPCDRASECYLVLEGGITTGTQVVFSLAVSHDDLVWQPLRADNGSLLVFLTIAIGGVAKNYVKGNIGAATYGHRPIPIKGKSLKIIGSNSNNLTTITSIGLLVG